MFVSRKSLRCMPLGPRPPHLPDPLHDLLPREVGRGPQLPQVAQFAPMHFRYRPAKRELLEIAFIFEVSGSDPAAKERPLVAAQVPRESCDHGFGNRLSSP